jgi:hypothetical protein
VRIVPARAVNLCVALTCERFYDSGNVKSFNALMAMNRGKAGVGCRRMGEGF